MFYTYVYHDGKIPFYVGKGDEKRAHSHLKKSHSKQVNWKIAKMRREGREPVVQLIVAPDNEHAKEMECLLIAMIGRRDLGLGPLLNGTDGGEGTFGYAHTKESKAKMSAAKKDIPRPDISFMRKGKRPVVVDLRASYAGEGNPFFGKNHSDESRGKIKEARALQVISEDCKLRISQSISKLKWWKKIDGSACVRSEISPGHEWIRGRIVKAKS